MSIAQTATEIVYPESNGKPMAETELHMEWMNDIHNRLKYRYRRQQVYVGGNMFVDFVEGDPRQVVAPDVFVVKKVRSRNAPHVQNMRGAAHARRRVRGHL